MKRLMIAATLALLLGACASQKKFEYPITIRQGTSGPEFSPAVKHVVGTSGRILVTNSLPVDHGFSIEGLKVKEVIPAGQTVQVRVGKTRPLDYEIFCQLHDVKTGKGKHQRALLRIAH